MSHLYNALEGELLRSMINTLNSGNIENIEDWQLQKMQQLRLYNKKAIQLLAGVTPFAEKELEDIFTKTVDGIIKDTNSELPFDTPPPPPTAIDNVMRNFSRQAWSEIDNYVNQTLVTTNFGNGAVSQSYTDVLNRTSALFNTGIYTREQALERSITELAEKGIPSSFIDKGGNRWSMERYVQTVMQSTLNNTYNEVKTERMSEFGVNTVVVTSHMGARQACVHIQGNVVDLRRMGDIPEDSEIRSIYDPYWRAAYLEPQGHRGTNCTHQHIPYIPGVSENNQPKYDEKENREVAKNRTIQRGIERNIVKYKKRFMVANELNTGQQTQWEEMITKWETRMEEHLEFNGAYLGRNLTREQVYTPLDSLMKEPEVYLPGRN